MKIDKSIKNDKDGLLRYFRSRADEILNELDLEYSPEDYKKKSTAFNKAIVKSKQNILSILQEKSRNESWSNIELLECALMVTYANDVVMLETRNTIWKYDYMAFSRRIGELWEPFCKLCFIYPLRKIWLYIPPLFKEVKKNLANEISGYIDNLKLKNAEKAQLKKYYDKVWGLVTSGEIQLECDLHFTDGTINYVVDFKSGFGSNEKGNTNRLLLVGSVYKNIESDKFDCLLFVRSSDNNHYLTTLKNSGVWTAFCGLDTYDRIKHFTGFNLHSWIEDNIDWINDFSPSMREYVIENELENYLQW